MANRLELGDAYSATIGRIRSQDRDKSRLGMAAVDVDQPCRKAATSG